VLFLVALNAFVFNLLADRAKQIKTKAKVNEDPTEKLIKDLKDENARLKKMLEGGNIQAAAGVAQTAECKHFLPLLFKTCINLN
jgi:hypothetical protein